jgi:TM2 domain-containing membrane protein YozV
MPAMSDDRFSHRPEQPRSEPEIIPPEHDQRRGDGPVWVSVDQFGGTHRIYVGRPRPFTILAVLFLAGLILAAIVLLLAGLVLFWIPVAVLIVAALILAGYVRRYWARLKIWAVQRLS